MTEIKVVRDEEKATAILKAIRQIDDGAELEPVVRCKDCYHRRKDYEDGKHYYCGLDDCWCCDTHFCSYGERKDGDG